MSAQILAALAKLDHSNDNHWTADGAPRVDVLKFFGVTATRDEISAVAPTFLRGGVLPGTEPAKGAADEKVVGEINAPGSGDASGGAGLDAPAEAQPAMDNLQRLEQEYQDANRSVQEMYEYKRDWDIELNKRITRRDAAAVAFDKAQQQDNPHKLTHDIGDYLKRQQEARDERARRMAELKGIKLADILPSKSPLDQALSRKNTRGTARPAMTPSK